MRTKSLSRPTSWICLGILTGTLWARAGESPGEESAIPPPVKAQLHLHGWSNHNWNPEAPASMQMQSYYASVQGVAVLWWSEHGFLFSPQEDWSFPLVHGRVDPRTLDLLHWPGGAGVPTGLKAEVSGGHAQAQLANGWLTMTLQSDPSSEDFQSFSYHLTGTGELSCRILKEGILGLSRPLMSEPVLVLQVEAGPMTGDTQLEVKVYLSAHYHESLRRQSLCYRFVRPSEVIPPYLEDNHQAVIPLPLRPGRNRVELNLGKEGALLPEGGDNTLSDLSLSVQARHGATCQVRFGEVRLTSLRQDPDYLLAHLKRFAAHYGEAYGITGLVGCEYNQRVSLNAYLPLDQVQTSFFWPQPADPCQFVAAIHRAEGLVSLNYPFGVEPNGPENLDPPAHQRARVLQIATRLLNQKVYGADILEVGYLYRGGTDLRNHLSLWDILLANDLFLCGVGVSDSHGQAWGPSMEPNPFVSWLWVRERSDRELLQALRHRRVFFGNPFRFAGPLDLRLSHREGNLLGVMGDTVTLDEDTALLEIPAQVPLNAQVRLYQGLLRSGRTVLYRREGELVRPNKPIVVDTSVACFVRVEVWDGETPLVFSNPIVVKKSGKQL